MGNFRDSIAADSSTRIEFEGIRRKKTENTHGPPQSSMKCHSSQ
jgi:hypothetical protein